jgi:hypothetical protein
MREMDEEDDGTGKNEHLRPVAGLPSRVLDLSCCRGPSALSGSRASEQGS